MIKRYHEAPKNIFHQVQKYTDGDYALVHLFETDLDYYTLFRDAVKDGRDVILDNSIFELGTSFDHDRFAYWINRLEPTWYIVPDVWKNGEATTQMFKAFVSRHPNLPGKRIGVAQGHTLEEVAKCYRAIEPECDMVAFNLDFSSYLYGMPEDGIPYCLRMSLGRVAILHDLFNLDIINTQKPHHLLGCGVPQEIIWYPKDWSWIRSIDTCNPVIVGMLPEVYLSDLPGMLKKPETKMCNCMNDYITPLKWVHIEHNLEMFKKFDDMRK